MSLNLLLTQVVNGLGVGMIYFMIAIGLSIIFGIMHFINIAHGAFYLVGAYLCYVLVGATGNFWLALALAPLMVGAMAWLAEPGVRRLYDLPASFQILATLGLALIIQEVVILIFDPVGKNVAAPALLRGAVMFGDFIYPKYRLFVIALTAAITAVLWFVLERTNYGAVLRAGTESMPTVELLGIDISRTFSLTFAIGAALTALAGVLIAPIRGVEPFMGVEALSIAFVVIVIGGIGSFTGALVGGLLIGVVQSVMTVFWAAGASIMIYVAMALIILLRPRGLLGRA
ncbi:branched-chain amino acid ABC transporter permease [Bradyrhizobium sp. U87765 SZCCT0131]|uniref:branched-chain amino acid ABC transporter permease n=1 Tax=unclassified Bradyrhizobium TaxID=2631580 RepID=UPI001BA88B28|nr:MULTISPECIES: branched-chain amino acid ABC transporter permease [unclassified Bradyrhizobium]MBR1220537.1 branched-chain amino acid ABC transporter permease [Bradyrhizobium sp. U87765 SZCCT0131]MBR1263008.1 branched-chain amino acid ABC transporter permease [Bradyrhizobium sp. U87765 SZCCT0134]MBR1307109.1 branched-chain amino acid ABC transporter permease [Bradyrhizobium sp. U87765 SZCCT0110]MBR1323003.1 branched-chain amino acid ABC transporter permease [Bradyrhizobium sp. U87765 SZCCT010